MRARECVQPRYDLVAARALPDAGSQSVCVYEPLHRLPNGIGRPMTLRILASHLSPGGTDGRLTTLIFHRVLPSADPLFPDEPDASRFSEILSWVGAWFQVMPLDAALQALHNGTLAPRALSITFDDGYADNHEVALPILQRHGMSATFFIATGFLDGGRMWNDTIIEAVRATAEPQLDLRGLALPLPDRLSLATTNDRRAAIGRLLPAVKYLPLDKRHELVEAIARRAACPLPSDLMLDTRQLRALRRAGMGIGAHTVHHPILARLDDRSAGDEIERGRTHLSALLGERIGLFAYPNGKPDADYTARCVGLVRELGFDAAVTTSPGSTGPSADHWQIPRFTPWDRARWRFGARLLANLRRPGQLAAAT
jgi:peptidoglycan/xylan/chitin deacetylase (PgdA/CDA1 family)